MRRSRPLARNWTTYYLRPEARTRRPNPGSSLSQNTVSFSTFSASTVRREIIFFPNRAMSPVPVSSMGRSSPSPEIELPPSNYDDHLVQVPAFGRSWPPTLNPPRIGPTEFQDPSSNCLIRDVETTLGKQVLNVPIAQRETAIEPDGMLDDDRWKAVTTVGYLAHPETLKHRPCRSHAVNVTMPFALLTHRDPAVPAC